MSFQEYLNKRRLEKALALMQDPNLSLLQICVECGFSDYRYLNRMFTKEFHCTITEYRQKVTFSEERTPNAGPASYSEMTYSREDSIAILRKSPFGQDYKEYEDIT